MTEGQDRLARLILGLDEKPDWKSTLQLALESACFHLGVKDLRGSDKDNLFMRWHQIESIRNDWQCPNDDSELFTAVLLLLISLEQIGVLFATTKNTGGAIKDFGDCSLSDEQLTEIRNLRHSLAHNFGLVSAESKPALKYILMYKDADDSCIIDLPRKPWNGDYSDNSDETSCHVYVFPLVRLVGRILANLKKKYESGELHINMDVEEARSKFIVIISK